MCNTEVHLLRRSLLDHSHYPRACVTFLLNVGLSSARLISLCSSPLVFTPMDPDIAADSPDGYSGLLARRHDSICGRAASRWRLVSTDTGKNEALDLHELECRRLQAMLSLDSWDISAWQRQQAPSAELSLVRESPRTRTPSKQIIEIIRKNNIAQSRNQVKTKRRRQSKNFINWGPTIVGFLFQSTPIPSSRVIFESPLPRS